MGTIATTLIKECGAHKWTKMVKDGCKNTASDLMKGRLGTLITRKRLKFV
jgi:hypothetical protein